MAWRDALAPARMERVAVVAPQPCLAGVLMAVSDARAVQLDGVAAEASVEETAGTAVEREGVSALVGWAPATAVGELQDRLGALGGGVARLHRPPGTEPPTLVSARGASSAFEPLVQTYATMPYADLDPAAFAGLAYVVMFGMMFGDVAHGCLLVIGGLVLRSGHARALSGLRRLAPFVIGGGVAAMLFGLAYGEAFGPTHAVPTLWLAPLDHPTTLLAVAVVAGGGLLAVAYALGTVNRWREGGPARALVATSGLAGAAVYLGLGLASLGFYEHGSALSIAGGSLAFCGLGFGFLGCYAETGGAVQAGVELFDSVIRIGTNTVSFARLAAFGLTHAALGNVIWSATTGLWNRGAGSAIAAGLVFLLGNAVSFSLEGLVAAVQALRLEYYELFSRIFTGEGRPFLPWHCPDAAGGSDSASRFSMDPPKEVSCSPG